MKAIATAALAAVLPFAALANETETKMRSYIEAEVMGWAQDQVLLDAIRAQNTATATLSQAEIDVMDQAWRAEVGMADRPTIAPVLDNAASSFLRDRVAAAGGVMTEVFVMDARGLNVATSDVTSDYWQGDEEKFTETYPNGAGAVHVGEVEFDESSQTYQGQISITIVDPASNQVVGAMTVGLNAESFF